MKVSKAISVAEKWINTYGIYNEFTEALDTLIDSGIKQLALEMKINELEVELDRCRTKEVYSGF
jgi:hypothetical protein